jgi:hypothetical protein
LETHYHRLQINLLHELTYQLLKNRTDFYCGGNMFLYYDLKQAEKVIQFVRGERRRAPYKGPDFFVVLGRGGRHERPQALGGVARGGSVS